MWHMLLDAQQHGRRACLDRGIDRSSRQLFSWALLSANSVALSMIFNMPCLLLQARMMKALIQGLPKGFVYGCAQGTLVGVEAGFSHTVADMTCAQVSGSGSVSFSKSFSLALAANALCLTEVTCPGA